MEHVRERQALASARILNEVLDGTDRPVILTGDFDATPYGVIANVTRRGSSMDPP